MEYDCREVALQVMKGYVNRAYNRMSLAWYGEANKRDGITEDLSIGYYFPFEEGTYGEFNIQWIELGSNSFSSSTPRIKIFDDFWHLLPTFRDFFEMLSQTGDPEGCGSISPDDFCHRLDMLGFVDHTPKARNKKPPEPDWATQRMRAETPFAMHKQFEHLFNSRLTTVVPFWGGKSPTDGVVTDEVGAWLDKSCERDFECFKSDVLFESEEDALLCQVRFS